MATTGMTSWKNPTEHAVRLDIFVSPGQSTRYEIAPNSTGEIPSQFDGGVHQVRDGIIVGGMAPQLVKEGTPYKLHSALAAPAQETKPKGK